MSKPEIYFSLDIETDGPVPGLYSMLSFALVAFSATGDVLGTFERNLDVLEGATTHPDTMAWWVTQPDAWRICHENCVPPQKAMEDLVVWVREIVGDIAIPVVVAYPVAFDMSFLVWYLFKFTGNSPFKYQSIDVRSYVMGKGNRSYARSSKKRIPRAFFSTRPHTHRALDDAWEQGELFVNLLKSENLTTCK